MGLHVGCIEFIFTQYCKFITNEKKLIIALTYLKYDTVILSILLTKFFKLFIHSTIVIINVLSTFIITYFFYQEDIFNFLRAYNVNGRGFFFKKESKD